MLNVFSHKWGEDLTAHVLGGHCVVLFCEICNRRKGKSKWHEKIWLMPMAKEKNPSKQHNPQRKKSKSSEKRCLISLAALGLSFSSFPFLPSRLGSLPLVSSEAMQSARH